MKIVLYCPWKYITNQWKDLRLWFLAKMLEQSTFIEELPEWHEKQANLSPKSPIEYWPFLKDKIVRTYITHGAPALPVKTLYFNSVKLRLVMGVYSFVFGWKLSLWFKTKQFWSVPFVSHKKREKYLKVVQNDTKRDLRKRFFSRKFEPALNSK